MPIHRQGSHEQDLPYADTLVLYRRLRGLPLPVLLASGSGNGAEGAFDILSAAPARILSTRGRITGILHATGAREQAEGNPLDILRAHMAAENTGPHSPSANDLPFSGGALGYFAYELLHPWHRVAVCAQDDIGLPSMLAGIYHWAVVLDHRRKRARFVARQECPEALRQEVLARLTGSAEEAPLEPFRLRETFLSNVSREEYRRACRRVIEYIHAGDCYQVNLAQRFSARSAGDPLEAFARLHRLADAPFSAFLESAEGAVLSFSPERFIKVNEGRVITQPIKGTRPRHANPARDRELLRELQASEKDRAENLMIVDLLRNDLGRVCVTGSVSVPALFEAHSFRNVHHLISTVEGRLARPDEVFDLLKAAFPGGSITGAPKLRAMEIISELETRPRSVYCGSIGYIGFDGNMDSNICIRSLVCAGGRIHCWGGGGIVADSVPDQEYQETLDKISLFLSNLDADGGKAF